MASFLPFVCTQCGARGGSYPNSGFEPHQFNCPLFGMIAPVDKFLSRLDETDHPTIQTFQPVYQQFWLSNWQPVDDPVRGRATHVPARVSVPRRNPVLPRRWCL